MTIAAIETRYAGCRFRSRLEARWAVFFDALGIPWKYEPQGYVVDGQPYLPDFWIGGDAGLWVEVKGELDRAGLAKLAAAAGARGLPLSLGDDLRGPADMDFGDGRGWIDLANPTLARILVLGDVPDARTEWIHPVLMLVNGSHVVEQPCVWWSTSVGYRCIPIGHWSPLGADPSGDIPNGGSCSLIKLHPIVADAYRSARSARFEHGESGGG